MNDVIIFHLLIHKLRRILPLKEFDLLEQESKKLLYFEGAGYFEYCLFTDMHKECLKLYNEFRPITKIPDSLLIDMIYRHNEFAYPEKWRLVELLEDGDWMIDNQN